MLSGLFGGGFSKATLKANSAMGKHRLQLMQNQHANGIVTESRKVAKMIRDKDFERARITVESVIRKQQEREAFGLLELYLDIVHTRVDLIATERTCADDLRESLHSILWAAKRVSAEELKVVAGQIAKKYGAKFAADAMADSALSQVNPRLREFLSISVPSNAAKVKALNAIAQENGISGFDAEKDCKLVVSVPGEAPPMLTPAMLSPVTVSNVVPGSTVVILPSGGSAAVPAAPAPGATSASPAAPGGSSATFHGYAPGPSAGAGSLGAHAYTAGSGYPSGPGSDGGFSAFGVPPDPRFPPLPPTSKPMDSMEGAPFASLHTLPVPPSGAPSAGGGGHPGVSGDFPPMSMPHGGAYHHAATGNNVPPPPQAGSSWSHMPSAASMSPPHMPGSSGGGSGFTGYDNVPAPVASEGYQLYPPRAPSPAPGVGAALPTPTYPPPPYGAAAAPSGSSAMPASASSDLPRKTGSGANGSASAPPMDENPQPGSETSEEAALRAMFAARKARDLE